MLGFGGGGLVSTASNTVRFAETRDISLKYLSLVLTPFCRNIHFVSQGNSAHLFSLLMEIKCEDRVQSDSRRTRLAQGNIIPGRCDNGLSYRLMDSPWQLATTSIGVC